MEVSGKRARAMRALEIVRNYRKRLAADPDLAAAAMRQWLSDGEWWSRKRLLQTHAIKSAALLTRTLNVLIEAGEVQVGRWQSNRYGGGAYGTYYRLTPRQSRSGRCPSR